MSSGSTPTLLTSEHFYDALAPGYATVAATRSAYLEGIDALVINRALSLHPQTYLDVGCGDGNRTLKIAQAVGARFSLAIDESEAMLAQVSNIETMQTSIVNLRTTKKFELVTALWNVLGHIDRQLRPQAIKCISSLMQVGGLCMFDVNNRYNAAAYGEDVVRANKEADEKGITDSGDVVAQHVVEGKIITTVGHVFHPDEIDAIIEETPDLQIVEKLFVDYNTGKVVGSPSKGQIFYVLRKVH